MLFRVLFHSYSMQKKKIFLFNVEIMFNQFQRFFSFCFLFYSIFCFFSYSISSASYSLSTIAGSGSSIREGVPAKYALFRGIMAIWGDQNGNLYVGDSDHFRIRKIDADGLNTSTIVTGYYVYDLWGNTNGGLFFSEPDEGICLVNLADNFISMYCLLPGVRGIWGDTLGNLYAAKPDEWLVYKISGNDPGNPVVIAGTGGPEPRTISVPIQGTLASLREVYDVWGDASGNLFLFAEYVYKMDASGIIVSIAKGEIENTWDSRIMGSADDLYLTGPEDGAVYKIPFYSIIDSQVNTPWTISVVAGGGGDFRSSGIPAELVKFTSLSAIFLDSNGDLFVGDSYFVRKVPTSNSDIMTIYAGQDIYFSGDDSPASYAQLRSPQGLFLDSNNNLYVAGGQDENRVRLITSTGIIKTIAGTGYSAEDESPVDALEAELGYISDVFLDSDGEYLFLVDHDFCLVYRLQLGSNIINRYAGNQCGDTDPFNPDIAIQASMNYPSSIWCLPVNAGESHCFICSVNFIREVDTNHIMSTIAGNGDPEATETPGPGLLTGINFATCIRGDTAGNLYYTDTMNRLIRKVTIDPSDGSTIVSTIIGGGNIPNAESDGTTAQLYYPGFLWIDAVHQHLVFTDDGFWLVRLYSFTTKRVVTLAGNMGFAVNSYSPDNENSTEFSLRDLSGVTGDTLGNIYFAEFTPNDFGSRIRKLTYTPEPSSSSVPTGAPVPLPISTPTPTPQPSAQPKPSPSPVGQPSSRPSSQPILFPTAQPSKQPLSVPTSQPSKRPSTQPSRRPSSQPTSLPTSQPSTQPLSAPSSQPSRRPSTQPSIQPTSLPTKQPISIPTSQPTRQPTRRPSAQPSSRPSRQPSSTPTSQPSKQPMSCPTGQPSTDPTSLPTSIPSVSLPAYALVTVAGSGASLRDGSPATSALLRNVKAVWGDIAGNIYVADYDHNRIRRFMSDGSSTSTVASGYAATDLWGNDKGSLFFCDEFAVHRLNLTTGEVRSYSPIEHVVGIWGDTSGTIYAAQQFGYQVYKITAQTRLNPIVVAGRMSAGDRTVNAPLAATVATLGEISDIWGDNAGNLYIFACNIYKMNSSGIIAAIALNVDYMWGWNSRMVGDSQGLYFSRPDNPGHTYRIPFTDFPENGGTANWNATLIAGSDIADDQYFHTRTAITASLNRPSGVFVDSTGQLFITDTQTVGKIPLTTNVRRDSLTIFAGENAFFSGDHSEAVYAQLDGPQGMWMDDKHNHLYIADFRNARVRRINTATGMIETVAGNGQSSGTGGFTALDFGIGIVMDVFVDSESKYLYIVDNGLCVVYRILLSGGFISRYAGTADANCNENGDTDPLNWGINYPHSIWCLPLDGPDDDGGHCFIASNVFLREVDLSSQVSVLVGNGGPTAVDNTSGLTTGISSANCVRGDTAGDLYYTDEGNLVIRKVTRLSNGDTLVNTIIGGGDTTETDCQPCAGTAAILTSPKFLWIDAKNENLVFTDQRSGFVRMYSFLSKQVINLAGNGTNGAFFPDTTLPTQFGLNTPVGITGDSIGNIYFSENEPYSLPGSRIRKLAVLFNPSSVPTGQPSDQPSNKPSKDPSSQPTRRPSRQPTSMPTSQPSKQPLSLPTRQPSRRPSARPSVQPTSLPTSQPSKQPLSVPTGQPSSHPSLQPSAVPSSRPSKQPLAAPTSQPSRQPSAMPSLQPISVPTSQPTGRPSRQPSSYPSSRPSSLSSQQPIPIPSSQPTGIPTAGPRSFPTSQPSGQPTTKPVSLPSSLPSSPPSSIPSAQPVSDPTSEPTALPTRKPSCSPSRQPSSVPTSIPSSQPFSRPSTRPSTQPTTQPSRLPTSLPTYRPSVQPTEFPSSCPSIRPSDRPTNQPSARPSYQPRSFPSTFPSVAPTLQPISHPSSVPSGMPSHDPTASLTRIPSSQPTTLPSSRPSDQPFSSASANPTKSEFPASEAPTISSSPTKEPAIHPSVIPTVFTSLEPTVPPTVVPTMLTTPNPTALPTVRPTVDSSSVDLSNAPSPVEISDSPSLVPSLVPSLEFPTSSPTHGLVSRFPTEHSTSKPPSDSPTCSPTQSPSVSFTSLPTSAPNNNPTILSVMPTAQPTTSQTALLTAVPSLTPSHTLIPTESPSFSLMPGTVSPTILLPTVVPSLSPTAITTITNSNHAFPTVSPTVSAATPVTTSPTKAPTVRPTASPTRLPSSVFPSSQAPQFSPSPSVLPTNSFAPNQGLSQLLTTTSFQGRLFLLSPRFTEAQMTKTIQFNALLPNQRNFVLFGRKDHYNFTNIHIDSRESLGLYTEIEASLYQDTRVRSTTIVGDVNNDGFPDLVEGFPDRSICEVYLGSSQGIPITNIPSFSIAGEVVGDGFGWSVSGLGDMNRDHLDDMIVCAVNSGICYVVFGRNSFSDFSVTALKSGVDGFKISGTATIYNGMAVSSAGDFNNDGFKDILLSCWTFHNFAAVFIVYGSDTYKDISVDALDQSTGLLIQSLPISYTGVSLTVIGDINDDGFDDIAISSLPFTNNAFNDEKTYVLYGKSNSARAFPFLLSQMTEKDGFIINGAGFMATRIGDVNEDGISDLLITKYSNWRESGNSYLIKIPSKLSSPPTIIPSSLPSSLPSSVPSSSPSTNSPTVRETTKPTTFMPSLQFNETLSPAITLSPTVPPTTRKPTNHPQSKPSQKPILLLTRKPTTAPLSPTLYPTFAIKPPSSTSIKPTVSPTTNLPTQSAPLASSVPTALETSSSTDGEFAVIYCDENADEKELKEGEERFCPGAENANNQFILEATGNIRLTGGRQRNIYFILPTKNQHVTINNFNLDNDIIDLTRFESIRGISDLGFFTNPLVIVLSEQQQQQIIFPSLGDFKLTHRNFLLSSSHNGTDSLSSSSSLHSFDYSYVIAMGLIPFLFLVVFFLLNFVKEDKSEEMKTKETDKQTNNSNQEENERQQKENIPQDDVNNNNPNENEIANEPLNIPKEPLPQTSKPDNFVKILEEFISRNGDESESDDGERLSDNESQDPKDDANSVSSENAVSAESEEEEEEEELEDDKESGKTPSLLSFSSHSLKEFFSGSSGSSASWKVSQASSDDNSSIDLERGPSSDQRE
jgi:sugar lactone lactonase YvrE